MGTLDRDPFRRKKTGAPQLHEVRAAHTPYEGKDQKIAVPPDPKIVGSVKQMYSYT